MCRSHGTYIITIRPWFHATSRSLILAQDLPSQKREIRDPRLKKNILCGKLNVFFLIRVYQWLCSVPQHNYAMVDQGARVWLPRFSFLPLSTIESRSWDCRCRSAWVNKVKTKNVTKASPSHRSVSRVCLFSPPLHCDLSPAKSHKRPWNDKSYR